MELQLSVFLLFILFIGGHSLRCYSCSSLTGSCADQQVTTCSTEHFTSAMCLSSVAATVLEGNTTKVMVKGCVPSYLCLYSNFSSADMSSSCCQTDLCNAKDAELSGHSSPNIPNGPNPPIPNGPNPPIPNGLNPPIIGLNPPIPNGKKCYYCIGESCLNIIDCSGTEDHCLKGTVTYQGQTLAVKSCATKAACDAATSVGGVASFTCCEGNLCNGAQSVTQSFLFLCCSLLSYFLLH